jgi:hypothetical protein
VDETIGMLPAHDKPFGATELVHFFRRVAARGGPDVCSQILCPLQESYAGIIWIAASPVNVRERVVVLE